MKFSVLISVYSKEKPANFRAALQSVIEQTLPPSEVVLIIDGPISGQLEQVVTNFTTKYPTLFKIIRFGINQGLGNALKMGVLAATHPVIARMDTDDISVAERFEKQIAFLVANPKIDVVGSNIEEFNEVPGDLKIFKTMPVNGTSLNKYAKYRNPLNHPSIIFRKSAVLAAGNYTEEIPLFEDYVLFVKMMRKNFSFYNLQERLLFFRVDSGLHILSKRSGWNYFKNEIKFLKFAKAVGHLTLAEFAISMAVKPLIRLFPKALLSWIYITFLRKNK